MKDAMCLQRAIITKNLTHNCLKSFLFSRRTLKLRISDSSWRTCLMACDPWTKVWKAGIATNELNMVSSKVKLKSCSLALKTLKLLSVWVILLRSATGSPILKDVLGENPHPKCVGAHTPCATCKILNVKEQIESKPKTVYCCLPARPPAIAPSDCQFCSNMEVEFPWAVRSFPFKILHVAH